VWPLFPADTCGAGSPILGRRHRAASLLLGSSHRARGNGRRGTGKPPLTTRRSNVCVSRQGAPRPIDLPTDHRDCRHRLRPGQHASSGAAAKLASQADRAATAAAASLRHGTSAERR
jgi:hypothetical protein